MLWPYGLQNLKTKLEIVIALFIFNHRLDAVPPLRVNLVPGPLQRGLSSISDSFWGIADINRCRVCLNALIIANQILLRKTSGVQQQEAHRKGPCNKVNSQDPKFRSHSIPIGPTGPSQCLPRPQCWSPSQAHLRLQLHLVTDRLRECTICVDQTELQSVWSCLVNSLNFDPQKNTAKNMGKKDCLFSVQFKRHKYPSEAANACWAKLVSDQVIEGTRAPNFANLNDLIGDSSHQLFLGGKLNQTQVSAVADVLANQMPEVDLKCLVDSLA